MKKTEIFEYFAFGFDYATIKDDGLKGRKRDDVVGFLEAFFGSLDELDLSVTKKVAEKLRDLFDQVGEGEEGVIKDEVAANILKEIKRLEPSLDAELQLRTAYVLTKKRYSLESLLNTPAELLGDGVYARLSDTSKRDFSLACIQIALSQPTAAAFHLMRALEEQVKMLYFSYKKINRLDKPMWGPMTNELRNKKAPKPTEKLLNHLDGMRVHFRNPTQHPELFYSLDEAQDLLNQTITAINMIVAELPK